MVEYPETFENRQNLYGIGVLLVLLLIASTAFLSLEGRYDSPATLEEGERYVNIYEKGEKPAG